MRHKHSPETHLVTVAEAARIAGRAPTWVRVRRQSGALIAGELDGKQAVTLRSLQRLLHEINMSDRPGVRHLRLVVDNTK